MSPHPSRIIQLTAFSNINPLIDSFYSGTRDGFGLGTDPRLEGFPTYSMVHNEATGKTSSQITPTLFERAHSSINSLQGGQMRNYQN